MKQETIFVVIITAAAAISTANSSAADRIHDDRIFVASLANSLNGKFQELFEKMTSMEAELNATKAELNASTTEVKRLQHVLSQGEYIFRIFH